MTGLGAAAEVVPFDSQKTKWDYVAEGWSPVVGACAAYVEQHVLGSRAARREWTVSLRDEIRFERAARPGKGLEAVVCREDGLVTVAADGTETRHGTALWAF